MVISFDEQLGWTVALSEGSSFTFGQGAEVLPSNATKEEFPLAKGTWNITELQIDPDSKPLPAFDVKCKHASSEDRLFSSGHPTLLLDHGYDDSEVDKTVAVVTGEQDGPLLVRVYSDFEPRLHCLLATKVTTVANPNQKNCTGDEFEPDSNQELEVLEKIKDFPEELLEKIISRMPFPLLFKARLLSKAWHSNLSLTSQFVQSLASSVQNEVTSVSTKWATYCPVFFSKEEILGFDQISWRWKSMLNLSYLPVATWSSIACAGSLICLTSTSEVGYVDIFVSNVVTKSWRKLPAPFPFSDSRSPWLHVRLLLQGSDAYKVMAVYCLFGTDRTDESEVRMHIYDSRQEAWTVKSCTMDEDLKSDLCYFFENAVYADGKFYCMGANPGVDVGLWIYRVEDNVWSPHSCRFDLEDCYFRGGLFLCGDKILLCTRSMSATFLEIALDTSNVLLYTRRNSVKIYQLDQGTLQLDEVSAGPPEFMVGLGHPTKCIFPFVEDMQFSCDPNYIYFGRNSPESIVLTFNVRSFEWGFLPGTTHSVHQKSWATCSFEPGLNPFVKV